METGGIRTSWSCSDYRKDNGELTNFMAHTGYTKAITDCKDGRQLKLKEMSVGIYEIDLKKGGEVFLYSKDRIG